MAAFGLGSGGSESEQMSPLRAIPQTAEVLGVTWTEGLLVFKDRCLGSFLSQGWVLRVGEPNIGFKHFAPQGKTWGVLSSLLIIDCCAGGGVYGDIVSQPFLLFPCWFSHLLAVKESCNSLLDFLLRELLNMLL